MGRRLKAAPAVRATEIRPQATYTLEELPALVRLSVPYMRREIAVRRLEARRVGGKFLILGQWLINWLDAQERACAGAAPAGE